MHAIVKPLDLNADSRLVGVSGKDGHIDDNSVASSDILDTTEHFDISSPFPSARGLLTPAVPRLALKNDVGHNVFRRTFTGPQTSRTHSDTIKHAQSIKNDVRVQEVEKVVGDVSMLDEPKGDVAAESSDHNLRAKPKYLCGQMFGELMTLRSKNEELLRQNALLKRDLDKRVAEGEQLKASLSRANIEIQALSQKLRAANDAQELASQELSEVRSLHQILQMPSESTDRVQLESDDSIASTRAQLKDTGEDFKVHFHTEHEAPVVQNHMLLQEVDRLREACRNAETEKPNQMQTTTSSPDGRRGAAMQQEACCNTLMVMDRQQEFSWNALLVTKAAVISGLALWNVVGFSKR